MEEIQHAFPDLKNGEIRNVLAAFLFTDEDVFKSISTLSGGERGRVALAKIMLSKANFLILDEPTNHLDILSKEILENALNSYEGTILYVSHDRYFINQTATKVIEMSKLGALEYLGDYDYYIEKKKELSAPIIPKTNNLIPATSKDDWKKQKEYQTQIKRLQNEISKVESQIETSEGRIAEIDSLLCLEEIYTDFTQSKDLMTEKEALNDSIKTLYEKWDELSVALDNLSE
jgi:ATP-binding cassette subfamily F protein 3